MVKVLGTICVILAVSAYILFSMYKHSQNKINALESEKNALEMIIKGHKNAQMESSITIEKLREQIRSNKEIVDWYNTAIPSDVLNVLYERHNRSKTN